MKKNLLGLAGVHFLLSLELVYAIEAANLSSNNKYISISFDTVNLFSNVPIAKSTTLFREYLNNCNLIDSFNAISEDIQTQINLIELISEQNFFTFKENVYTMTDGLPMGLTLSALLAKIYISICTPISDSYTHFIPKYLEEICLRHFLCVEWNYPILPKLHQFTFQDLVHFGNYEWK